MSAYVQEIPTRPDVDGMSVPQTVVESNLRQPDPPASSFEMELRATPDRLWRAVEFDFRSLAARHARAEYYLKDKHFLDVDPRTNEVYEVRPSRKYAHINNQFAGFIDAAIAQIAMEDPKLVAKCRKPEKSRDSMLRDVQHWAESDRPFTQEDKLIVAYMLKLRGRVWFSTVPTLDGPPAPQPQTGMTQLGGGPPAFFCHDCQSGGYLDAPTATPQAGIAPQSVPGAAGTAQPGVSGTPPMGQGQSPQPMAGAPSAAPGGPPQAQPMCPNCGSPAVEVVDNEATEIEHVTGYQNAPSVRINTEVVDDLEMRWYVLMRKPERSPWVERVRFVMLESLQEKFPWADIPKSTAHTNQMYGIQGPWLEEFLTATVGSAQANPFASSGYSRAQMGADVRREFREIWQEPMLYANKFWKEDVKFANGVVIPAGTKAGEIFPDGLYMAWTGNLCLDIRNEAKEDIWADCPHKLSPSGGFARGSESLLALQDRLNLQEVYALVHLLTESTGLLLYNTKKVSGTKIRKFYGQPGGAVGVDKMLANDKIDGSIAAVLSPKALTTDPEQAAMASVAAMQGLNATYVTNPSQLAAQGKSNSLDTATGVNELSEQIKVINAPMTALLYAARSKIQGQRLRASVKFCNTPVYAEAKDPFGRSTGKQIDFSRFDQDYFFEPDPDAFQTRTNADKKRDLIAGINAGAFAPELPIEQRRAVQQTFGLDEMFEDDYLTWQERSYKRLDALKEQGAQLWPVAQMYMADVAQKLEAAQAQGMPPPVDEMGQPVDPGKMILDKFAMDIASQADPMDPRDRDDVFLETYTRYWSTAEAEADDPLTQAAILNAFLARRQHIMQMEAEQQMEQMQAMAPVVAAQGAMQQGMADQQADGEVQRNEVAAENEHSRKTDQAEQQHGHRMAEEKQKQSAPPKKGN